MGDKKTYCGAYWMPKWLVDFLSSRFNASCKIHDLDYESGKYGQKESDKRFLDHMCKQTKKNNIKCGRIMAYIFYASVRIAGRISWNKAKKDRKG